MSKFPKDPEFAADLVDRRDAYCVAQSRTIADHSPGVGLEAVVWPTTDDSMLKVHRNASTFHREVAVYLRLKERRLTRLRGFNIPQLSGL